MNKSMNRIIGSIATAAAMGTSAHAVVVNPGQVVALGGTSAASSVHLQGGSPGGATRLFEVRDSSNAVVFTGTLLFSWVDTPPFARRYYTMRLQKLTGVAGRQVVSVELSGFGTFQIDTNYRSDFAAAPFPDKVTRSADGETLRFDFPIGVTPGQNSQFFYVYTLSSQIQNTGTGRIILNTGEFGTITNVPMPAAPAACPGDATGDGVVNFADLNTVLTNFGQACP